MKVMHYASRLIAGLTLATALTYAVPASAQINLGQAFNSNGEQGLWQPFAEVSGRVGGDVDGGELSLFLPLWQTESQLLFADLRGKLFDNSSTEGNWGLAYRSIIDEEWILGAYSFGDLRETQSNNRFLQGVFGLEAMTNEWEFRANAYLAEGGAKDAGAFGAILSGNQILIAGGQERAYSGFDMEAGALLWTPESRDVELRAYAGGFYFDNNAAGFPEVAGPRARVELRLYDLDLLGQGSRIVLGGTVQHDDVRDTQGIASLQVRIPFGPGGHQSQLAPLQRRMVDPIQRDIDIVTQASGGGDGEATLFNGRSTGMVAQISASDLATSGPPATFDTLLVTGEGGTGMTATPITIADGKNFIGGGQTIMVQGASSGRTVPFLVPGTRPTIAGTDMFASVFSVSNNSSLVGFDITGGGSGVSGGDVSDIAITNNDVSGAEFDGISLAVLNSGTISGNTVRRIASSDPFSPFKGDGFRIGTMNGGTVSGNMATENGTGFSINVLDNGLVSANTSSDSERGFLFLNIRGGTVSENSATNNTGDLGSQSFGFQIFNEQSAGTFIDNTANGNANGGFNAGTLNVSNPGITGGDFSRNDANNNGGKGYDIKQSGGTATGNTGSGNTGGDDTYEYP